MINDKKSKKYKVVDQYVFNTEELLGKGTFGSVYFGQDQIRNFQVAVKQISMDIFNESRIINSIRSEIKNMQLVKHPNIVKLYDVKKTSRNLYLIVEYCNNGSLEHMLQKNHGRLSEYVALKIIRQIVMGYRALYENNIVHRDIKPANILLHNGEAKLSDFGFSKVVEAGMEEKILQSYVGSPQYMSPQILNQQQYSSKTDVWSLGFVFYEILYGKLPWSGKTPNDHLDKIEKLDLLFPSSPAIDIKIKQIIKNMLVKDEAGRLRWEDIFNDPLFQEVSEDQIIESLKSVELSHKNNYLSKTKALAKLFFENNKVMTSPYDCDKTSKINQLMINNLQNSVQKMDEEVQVTQKIAFKQQDENDEFDMMFSQQKTEQENLKKIQRVSQWAIHRRNYAVFIILIAIDMDDFCVELNQQEIDTQVLFRCTFILLQKHIMMLFKLYQIFLNEKQINPDKFPVSDIQIFMNSNEKNMLKNSLKSDFSISKNFFDEYLNYTKNRIKKQGVSQEEIENIKQLEDVVNNKFIKKQTFDNLWNKVLNETNLFLQQINNKQKSPKYSYFLSLLIQSPHIFKYEQIKKMDFSKLYQEQPSN